MLNDAVWEKLLKLRPELPRHAHIQQRYYGDELWYILNDKSSGKFHRFNEIAYLLLGFMDGRNHLDQILILASRACEDKGLGQPPTKDDLIELLQYLYVADLMVCDFTPSTEEMFNRNKRKKDLFWQQLIKNPYVWKFTICNPDRLLNTLLPLAKIIASPFMAFVWFFLLGYACLQVGNHWPELSQHSFDHILSSQNLFLLWLIYPVLKVIHELGHGLFTKAWGGSVHEFGIVFVLGTPLPYVDATSATAFPKGQRLMVGAAGMAVELFFAALALIVWININDGLLRDICFNVMLIGSISTLFFNGNPLMKFDGYHILCDAIDQPNLAARSLQQLRYLTRYYGYNIRSTVSPSSRVRESWGLAVYGLLAFLYRFIILISIVYIVSSHFPTVGLMFAIWLGFFQIILPVAQHLIYLMLSKDLGAHRLRAIGLTASVVIFLSVIFFVIPFSHKTSVQGVVWLPKSVKIQTDTAGEVVEYLVEDGELLQQGQAVVRMINAELNAELRKKKAYLVEYQARYEEAWSQDHSKSRLFEQDINTIQSEIQHLELQVENLIVRSPSSGVFKEVFHHQVLGSFINQGETIGLILNDLQPTIRLAVTQQEVGVIKADTQAVEVKVVGLPGVLLNATISQEVPKATYVLPSPVLGTGGGGEIVVNSSQEGGTHAMERVFIIDLTLPQNSLGVSHYGMRTYVAFLHTKEVLFKQLSRSLRQVFIDLMKND